MKTMTQEWQDYARSIFPNGMTPEQEKELHRAFFAGAICCFQMVQSILKDPSQSDCQSLARFAAVEQDIFQQFATSVGKTTGALRLRSVNLPLNVTLRPDLN